MNTENFAARIINKPWPRLLLFISLLLASVLVFSLPAPALAGGVYTGTAFRDYNANGTQNSGERGIAGVIVNMYNKNGVNQGSDTTAAGGSYSIDAGGNGPYRIEFTLPADQSFLKAGAAGDTTVQFVANGGGTADVGFNNPADYSGSTNPDLVTSRYVEGNNNGTQGVLVSFPYNNSGSSPSPSNEALASQIGTTYGLAYQRSSDTLFAAAYQKRHTGFGSADSTGAIYAMTNPGDGATTDVSLFVDLNALYGSDVFGTNPHPKDSADFYVDGDSYAVVGKIAFGDMDIAEDELSLWTINLNDRQLYQIPLGNDPANPAAPTVTSNIKRYPLADSGNPLPDLPSSCANNDIRPFAVKMKDGLVYVGLVCSGEDTGSIADARGLVYAFDPVAESFDRVLVFGLSYNRGRATSLLTGANTANWNAWDSAFASTDFAYRYTSRNGDEVGLPQPILADIEFDDAGNMILGFRDRFGDQFGFQKPDPNGDNDGTGSGGGQPYRSDGLGDILRATPAGDNWSLSQTEATNGTEFFNGDNYITAELADHDETSNGGLAILPGAGEVVNTVFDPINNRNWAGGVDWHNTSTGSLLDSYEVFRDATGSGTSFGKSNGVGDLEVLYDPAPLEVGNRLWCDSGSGAAASDNNGLQDPGETTLPAGIDVTMTCGGQSATVATDANGDYLFTDAIWAAANSGDDIPRSTSCTISVATTGDNGTAINNACGLTTPTLQNAAQPANGSAADNSNDPITDVADSDASAGSGGDNVEISFTTGAAGENNHGLDFGFGLVTVKDWGDLPDSFDTSNSAGGPAHTIDDTLYLGACVDAEVEGQPDAQAGTAGGGSGNGDDGNSGTATGTCANNDDEDGITLVTPLVPGGQACVAVTALNSSGGAANLYGWVDFNGNGAFDAGEALTGGSGGTGGDFSAGSASVANNYSGSNTYCFQVPANATFTGGETHMRFRLTTDTLGTTDWGGTAADGEVEDYYSQLACVGNYLWIDTGTTPNTQDDGDTPVANGTDVNLVWGGSDGVIGSGSDDVTYSTKTGAGGIYNFCGVIPNANGAGGDDQYQVIVPTAPGTPVTANVGSVALDSNGTANGLASQSAVFTVPVPNSVLDNAPNDSNPNSYPGNQTDLSIDFGFEAVYDFSDLPENPYPTTLTNGARHLIDGSTFLGACVDAEADGLPDNEAGLDNLGGDDNNGSSPANAGTCATAGDDEDGVTFLTPMAAGRPASFQVTTSGDSCLSVFVDFDNDGSLDVPVIAAGSSTGSAGSNLSDVALTGSGPHAFAITVPANASGVMYSRFRLTAACDDGGSAANGLAGSGEVEDYVLGAVGDLMWEDDNVDGIQNEAAPVNGATVRLLDSGGSAVNDAAGNPITTTTNGSGIYGFPGLLPGMDYIVEFVAPAGYAFSPANQGNDDTLDSDANVFNGQTVPLSVAPAQYDENWDAAIYAIENPAIGNRVWFDANGNAVLDSNEDGIAGATLTLRQDTGADGPDAADPIRATILSDGQGFYLFANVAPGTDYFVCVDASTTGYPRSSDAPWGPPSTTEEDQATGDDGQLLFTTQVCSQLLDVVLGSMPTDDLATPIGYDNNDADMKIDFGFSGSPTAVSLSDLSAGPAAAVWPAILVMLAALSLTVLFVRRRGNEAS